MVQMAAYGSVATCARFDLSTATSRLIGKNAMFVRRRLSACACSASTVEQADDSLRSATIGDRNVGRCQTSLRRSPPLKTRPDIGSRAHLVNRRPEAETITYSKRQMVLHHGVADIYRLAKQRVFGRTKSVSVPSVSSGFSAGVSVNVFFLHFIVIFALTK